MKKFLLSAVSIAMLLTACNNSDEIVTPFNDNNPQGFNEFAMSNEEVKDALNFFVNDGATTRSDTKTVNVKNYIVKNIEVKIDDKTEIVPVYEYTTINEKGEEGYSIIVADRRIQKVLVQVEKGSLADTAKIEPLKWYINSIPNIISANLQKYNANHVDKPTTRSINSYVETHYCFLPTHWSQESPYNDQCEPCNSEKNCPTGCVPLAMAQILAYHQVPASLSWSSILQSYQITSSSSTTVKYQVANLLVTLGSLVNADYSCNETRVYSTDFWRIANTFRNTYSMQSDNLHSFDLDDIISSLAYNRPVYMRANGSDSMGVTIGHAWVCDGWKRHHYDPDYYDYLDMNWGYAGFSNGFYYIDSPMSFVVDSDTLSYNFEIITNIRP